MDTETFKATFQKNPRAQLILTNNYGESYATGNVDTYHEQKNGIKMRWLLPERPTNIHPFTTAVITDGKKILSALTLPPTDIIEGKQIELVYNL